MARILLPLFMCVVFVVALLNQINCIQVSVRNLKLENITFEANPSDSIEALKLKIVDKEKIPLTQLHLTYNGFKLRNDIPLLNYGIKDGSLVFIEPHGMLIFVKPDDGETMQLWVAPEDTLDSLKLKVHEKGKIPLSEVYLFFCDQFLDGNHELSHYNIQKGSTIRLANDPPEEPQENLQIFVKTMFGKIISIDATPNDSIKTIKTKIEIKEGIKASKQNLIYAGRTLEDFYRLKDCKISTGSTLNLGVQLRSGLRGYITNGPPRA